ncbi:MAG TPA: hypothetical protein DD412_06790 [Holosporales bacterium]|nr:hypothetical protein [Holosporales bacterium]
MLTTEHKPRNKWHFDEMIIKMNGESFIRWRAVDSQGYGLKKHKNKKAALRFLSHLLRNNPVSCVIIIDKLRSYFSLYVI